MASYTQLSPKLKCDLISRLYFNSKLFATYSLPDNLVLLSFSVDSDPDEGSLSENTLPEDAMSPDSNHNLQLMCHESAAVTAKRSRIRNGSIDDQQQAMMEAIEAMESIRVMNGSSRNADDSFDESQDEQHSSQKYYMADTPSSDLVIDERSTESHSMELLDSSDVSESFHRTEEESNSDKGR